MELLVDLIESGNVTLSEVDPECRTEVSKLLIERYMRLERLRKAVARID